jgi:hypothetical protein
VYQESKSKGNIRMASRVGENHKINRLEQLDRSGGAARCHVAGVVVVGAVVVFGGEQGADVGL